MITNGQFIAMQRALGVLGNRSMATVNADLKVGRMLAAMTPEADRLQKAKNRVITELTNGLDLAAVSPFEQTIMMARIEVARSEFDGEANDFDLPKGVLRQEDLPKEKVGDEGWKNASQLGAIVADLGPLFEFPKE